MVAHADNQDDNEQLRNQQIEELVVESGPDWADRFKPGSFGCHELLDRSLIAAEFVEETVLTHPACIQNQEWYALANKATMALHELYQ